MSIRHGLVGAVAGAAIAAAAVVAVYEVGVRSPGGSGAAVAPAGERAATGAVPGSPALLARTPGVLLEPPPPDVTREQLLERDAAMRARIAALETRLRGREAGGEARGGPGDGRRGGGPERKFRDLGHDELVEMARSCEIRYDLPPFGEDPPEMSPGRVLAGRGP